MTTFNIVEDTEIIRDNGFFCEACLIGKSFSEHSPDTRYCKGCYEVLQNEKVALTDYWCENGAAFAHYGKKYSIDKSLKTICVGEAAKTIAKEKPVSPEKPPVDCASFANCSAPLCPMNASSLLRGIWYISEPICGKKGKPEWIRTQNKVAKKATDSTRYFTYQQLLKMKRVAKPRGKNPDSPLKVDISNNRRGKKTKGKVSSARFSPLYPLSYM